MAAIELAVGIGCQRGTSLRVLERGVDLALAQREGVVRVLATVDAKRDEPGILQLARERGWQLAFFSAAELGEGVAEPAAAKFGRIVMPKRIHREPSEAGSMTVAIAVLP